MQSSRNKQASILSMGKKRSKNKIQRRNNNRDGIRETEKTAEDRRTEIILYAE